MAKARQARAPRSTPPEFLSSPTDEDAVSALLGYPRDSEKSDPATQPPDRNQAWRIGVRPAGAGSLQRAYDNAVPITPNSPEVPKVIHDLLAQGE